MKKCFWLTSYPKSGNTWFRLIIGGLFFTENGKIENFDVLKKIEEESFFPENNENSSFFFRKGSSNQWQKHVNEDQIKLITDKFQVQMKELEYSLKC